MQKLQNTQIFHKFIGAWKLVECIDIHSNGNTTYPWGPDAIGCLMYTPEGIMSVQIMPNKDRSSEKNKKSGTDAIIPEHDYYAYFGPFEIDEANNTIVHIGQAHINPAMIGKKNIRTYSFFDNKLLLVTPENRKLLWQKL